MEVSPLASAILSFIFVIGLLLLTLWFVRAKGIGITPRSAGDLQVVQTLRLGTKHHLSVVKYGNRTLLLGVSGQQISLLDNQLSEDADSAETDVAQELSSTQAREQSSESFVDHLKGLLVKR